MELHIGQKVAYPGQGVCLVECIKTREVGERSMNVYLLRVLHDNSTIFVPTEKAGSVGIRPLISGKQCRQLIGQLSEDFESVTCNWKTRSRAFMEKLHSGDIFEAAVVLKQLTFLSQEKRLSFREQTLLEKAKFLIVSEISNANRGDESMVETEVIERVASACTKHHEIELTAMSAVTH